MRSGLSGVATRSLILLPFGAASSARETHWAATMPLLKYEEMCGVFCPVIVSGGVRGLAVAGSGSSPSLLAPTTGTTEYWTTSPGLTP